MWATLYGEKYKRHYFDINDINFVIENRLKCITYFSNGEEIDLSWIDMKKVLCEFAKVYSHDLGRTLYLNPKNIANYTFSSKYDVDVEMKNGIKLETLLRADFERNVLTRLNQEQEREI